MLPSSGGGEGAGFSHQGSDIRHFSPGVSKHGNAKMPSLWQEVRGNQSRQVVFAPVRQRENKRPLQGGAREEGDDGEVPACEVETLR